MKMNNYSFLVELSTGFSTKMDISADNEIKARRTVIHITMEEGFYAKQIRLVGVTRA